MRRIVSLALSALFALTLTACGTEDTAARAETVRERCAERPAYTTEATVTLVREPDSISYTLRVEAAADETRVTVLAPALLAGTTARLTGDALALEYDGLILDAGSAAKGLSAVNCVPLTLRAVADGTLLEQSEEAYGDCERALRLSLESEASGATLRYTVYFDASGAPLGAEIAENEKIAAFMEFTSFEFCAKISEDGAAAQGQENVRPAEEDPLLQ